MNSNAPPSKAPIRSSRQAPMQVVPAASLGEVAAPRLYDSITLPSQPSLRCQPPTNQPPGKSFLLSHIVGELRREFGLLFGTRVAVTAATGIAATHISGAPGRARRRGASQLMTPGPRCGEQEHACQLSAYGCSCSVNSSFRHLVCLRHVAAAPPTQPPNVETQTARSHLTRPRAPRRAGQTLHSAVGCGVVNSYRDWGRVFERKNAQRLRALDVSARAPAARRCCARAALGRSPRFAAGRSSAATVPHRGIRSRVPFR